jgi:hypothetical protein
MRLVEFYIVVVGFIYVIERFFCLEDNESELLKLVDNHKLYSEALKYFNPSDFLFQVILVDCVKSYNIMTNNIDFWVF